LAKAEKLNNYELQTSVIGSFYQRNNPIQ